MYNLKEPTAHMKAQFANAFQLKLFAMPRLRLTLRVSFIHAHGSTVKCMPKAKLNKTVCRIASKSLLGCVLKKRMKMAGLLLKTTRALNNLDLPVNKLGERFHTLGSESFFYHSISIFTHFHRAPYSYYSHASMSSTTTNLPNRYKYT